MNSRRLILLTALSVAVLITATAGTSDGWVQRATSPSPAQRNGKGQTETVRFVALGDTGTGGKGQFAVARQMVGYHDQKRYDTVLLLGDNVYPHGDAAELPLKFEQPYAELLRRGVRFHAVLGNHDVDKGARRSSTTRRSTWAGGHITPSSKVRAWSSSSPWTLTGWTPGRCGGSKGRSRLVVLQKSF